MAPFELARVPLGLWKGTFVQSYFMCERVFGTLASGWLIQCVVKQKLKGNFTSLHAGLR